VQWLHVPRGGELVGAGEITDLGERIVLQRERDLFLAQLCGKPGMPIEVELQSKWTPGRYTQVAQSEFGINEVKIVMQALAGCRFEKRLARWLIVPGFVGRARFHRGDAQRMHQPGLVAAFFFRSARMRSSLRKFFFRMNSMVSLRLVRSLRRFV